MATLRKLITSVMVMLVCVVGTVSTFKPFVPTMYSRSTTRKNLHLHDIADEKNKQYFSATPLPLDVLEDYVNTRLAQPVPANPSYEFLYDEYIEYQNFCAYMNNGGLLKLQKDIRTKISELIKFSVDWDAVLQNKETFQTLCNRYESNRTALNEAEFDAWLKPYNDLLQEALNKLSYPNAQMQNYAKPVTFKVLFDALNEQTK